MRFAQIYVDQRGRAICIVVADRFAIVPRFPRFYLTLRIRFQWNEPIVSSNEQWTRKAC